MVTNQELNQRREPGCWGVTQDKKYFHVGNSCIKRTLRRHEWITLHDENLLIVPPATIQQRWRTDAAALRFLAERTNIPLPPFQFVMEDDGAFYHATEFVEGVSMKHLNETDKQVVKKELMQHMETLRSLTSETPGVPGEELLCPPARVSGPSWKMHSCWKPKQIHAGEDKYVFCHNDLGQHNIIVDPETFKINAIIDWEFAGFWPEWFEGSFFERPGPSVALGDEEDDRERCRQWLQDNCHEVPMCHLGAPQGKNAYQEAKEAIERSLGMSDESDESDEADDSSVSEPELN